MGMSVYMYGLHVYASIHLHGYVYRYDFCVCGLGGDICLCVHTAIWICVNVYDPLWGAYVTMYMCMCKCIGIYVSVWATVYVFGHSMYEFQSRWTLE